MEDNKGGWRRPPPKASVEAFFSPTGSTTATAARRTSDSSSASSSSSSSSGSGSGWKDRLKQRCLKRVRDERSRLVQELRGIKSPPPPGSASRPSALHSPSPTSLLQPQAGGGRSNGGGPGCPTPSFMSSAVMSILQDEMRAARRTQVEGEAGGDELDTDGMLASPMMTMTMVELQEEQQQQQQQQQGGDVMTPLQRPPTGRRRSTKARLSMDEVIIDNNTEEWNKEEEKEDDEDGFDALSPEERVELMQCIEEALQAEVRAAEEQALEEYSQLENYEIEAFVKALYDDETLLSADDVAVLCPCCKANFLLCQNGEALCACGLRVEAAEGAGSLAWLQERLAGVYAHHKGMCVVKEPMFFQRGVADLWVECVTCGLSAQIL